MTRVAIIGAGRWGKNIITTLRDDATTIAYIAYSGSADTKAWLDTNCSDIPLTTDHEEVYKDQSVDVVIIATPISTHVSLVRAALAAGKHVFVEKPLAATTADVAELYATAQEKNLTLFTGYLYAYDPAFLMLTEILKDASELTIESVWEKYGTFDTPLVENLLVHELALATHLLGTLSFGHILTQEKDIFVGDYVGERGTVHFRIDRTCNVRKKILTVRTTDTIYTLTPARLTKKIGDALEETLYEAMPDMLLKNELTTFFSEGAVGAAGNKKRQRIDESTAAVLEALPLE